MKKIILFFLLIPSLSKAQDSTVSNLQLRSRTIKLLASFALETKDTSMLKTFVAWNVEYKSGNPADNANVTIATARTVDVASMYEYLLNLPSGLNEVEDFCGDFKTSIQSLRNTNELLDELCLSIEAAFDSRLNTLKNLGNNILNIQ